MSSSRGSVIDATVYTYHITIVQITIIRKKYHTLLIQYTDDSFARYEDLLQWWIQPNNEGPFYGYHPEGSKS